VPGSSQNWNGTKKGDVATELTIVQDFHQVKSVPNTLGSDNKKEEKAEQGTGIYSFLSNMMHKVKSFFQMSW